MDGKNQSRRDDLESLGYTFMFLINPAQIPWAQDKDMHAIKIHKRKFMAEHNPFVEFLSIQEFIKET